MSTFAELIQDPFSDKVTIFEMDIGQQEEFWINTQAFVYKRNFDNFYPELEAWMYVGIDPRSVDRVGSVRSDGLNLTLVANAGEVQANELSFYWDHGTKTLYVHLQNHDEPSLHQLMYGLVIGVANHAGTYGGFIYEGRLKSIPSIAKRKDPLFFGKLSFEGGQVNIDNTDGKYDRLAEDYDIFGNSARIFQGFADLDYEDFEQQFRGAIGKLSIGNTLEVEVIDQRKSLSKKIPDKIFDKITYPNLKDGNIGKDIPIGYGTMRNVPVICTNEAEAPAPAKYSFKLFDTTDHSIKDIIQVYVNGVTKAHGDEDLVNATFTLAAANYSPGQKVTVDCQGYVDAGGNLITNGLDVIKDLLCTYFPINYNSNYFNIGEWEAARSKAPDICYFSDKPIEIIDIIEEICETLQGLFDYQLDGRYTFRLYNPFAPTLQSISKEKILNLPVAVGYDPTEVLAYVRAGYNKDWAEDEYQYWQDESKRVEVNERYKQDLSETFETLLITEIDAKTFAENILSLAGNVSRPFQIITKLQTARRQIGDFIEVELNRMRKTMLGWARAEILGKSFSPDDNKITLDCRIVELIPDMISVEGIYYDNSYYGDGLYSESGYEEVA